MINLGALRVDEKPSKKMQVVNRSRFPVLIMSMQFQYPCAVGGGSTICSSYWRDYAQSQRKAM